MLSHVECSIRGRGAQTGVAGQHAFIHIEAQAGAIRHGISKALASEGPERRAVLKKGGFLTRDARKIERKKYGQPGARKRFQYSKR